MSLFFCLLPSFVLFGEEMARRLLWERALRLSIRSELGSVERQARLIPCNVQ